MPVSEHGQLQLVSGDQEITPGVRVVLTAGHTGGHQIVVGSTSVPGTGVQNTEYRVQSTEYIEERRKTDDERRTTDQGRRTTFVYWGDLIPTASHLSIPYVMGYDTMPLVTMEQKEKLLKQALDEQWLMFFEHDPEISGGYLAEENGRYVVKGLETGDGDGRK
jgi:glyoxylase-like metal-dependent hydrolase (beta-lactamase superfamily II)